MDEPAECPWPAPDRVEQLLNAAAGSDPAGPAVAPAAAGEARLAAVVRALTATVGAEPPDPVRENAALVAFRVACLEPAGRSRPSRALAGGLAAVLALSGLAVAAGTGVLPDPFRGPVVHAGPPAARQSATPLAGRLVPDGGESTRTPERADGALTSASVPPTTPPTPTGQAARSLLSTCLRYTHAVRHGRQPDAESAEQLRLAAGGTDRIGPYCRGLVAAAEAGQSESGQSESGLSEQGQSEQGQSESGKNGQGQKPHTPGSAKRP